MNLQSTNYTLSVFLKGLFIRYSSPSLNQPFWGAQCLCQKVFSTPTLEKTYLLESNSFLQTIFGKRFLPARVFDKFSYVFLSSLVDVFF